MMPTDYLATMESALGPLDEARRQEIVAEIGGHLEDKAHELMLRGLSQEASMQKAMEALGDPAELGRELRRAHRGFTRQDACLAALPPAIFGLSMAILILLSGPLTRLVIGGPTRPRYPLNSVGLVAGGTLVLLALLTLAAGGVIAAVRRLPLWGHSWTGAAVMGVMFMLIIAGDDRPYLVSPVVDVLLVIVLLLILGAALASAGWHGPFLGGLAGLSTAMILSLAVVWCAQAGPFSRLDLALLTAPLGLVYSSLLYGFVTGLSARRTALLGVGGLLCLGAMAGVEYGVFWQWRLDEGQTEQIWVLLAVGMILLAFGPAVGLVAGRLRVA